MTADPHVDPVAAHVAELGRALRGPAKARRDVLREVRDGLSDAADAYRRAGVDADRAARLAVRDFGPVAGIAPLYQDELVARQGMRTAHLLAGGVPGVLLGWDLLIAAGYAGPGAPAGVLAEGLDAASIGMGIAALALIALVFRRTRRPRRVAGAVAVATLGAVLLSAGSVATSVVGAEQTWLRLAAPPVWVLAHVVTTAVLVLMSRSALRTLRALRAPVPC